MKSVTAYQGRYCIQFVHVDVNTTSMYSQYILSIQASEKYCIMSYDMQNLIIESMILRINSIIFEFRNDYHYRVTTWETSTLTMKMCQLYKLLHSNKHDHAYTTYNDTKTEVSRKNHMYNKSHFFGTNIKLQLIFVCSFFSGEILISFLVICKLCL